jgi:hypothetical protein
VYECNVEISVEVIVCLLMPTYIGNVQSGKVPKNLVRNEESNGGKLVSLKRFIVYEISRN